jgi:hypothetical protein
MPVLCHCRAVLPNKDVVLCPAARSNNIHPPLDFTHNHTQVLLRRPLPHHRLRPGRAPRLGHLPVVRDDACY